MPRRRDTRRRRPPAARMGQLHASRLDRLESEIGEMFHTTDWRDLSCGNMPSARASAMLDWLQDARPALYDDVRETLAAIPFTVRLDDETHPGVQAYTHRLQQVEREWNAAGQPDPRGAMDPSNRAMRIRSHEISLDG